MARILNEYSNTLIKYVAFHCGKVSAVHDLFCFLFFCRLAKEEVLYIKEAKQQEERVERLKAEAGDEYLIKKQVNAKYKRQQKIIRGC